jgi:DNA-binding transcriptional regulator YiaG
MNAESVKKIRLHLGLTQDQFAAKIGVHRMTVSKWETGANSPTGMALQALERLAQRAEKRKQS